MLTRGSTRGVLSGQKIKEYNLILNSRPDSFKSASYDLRLGEAHYVFSQDSRNENFGWQPYYIGENLVEFNSRSKERTVDSAEFKRQDENNRRKLCIPPYGSAFIQLFETVNTLDVVNTHQIVVAGRFDLRLSLVFQGLISQQATQVEPYYKGKLFCFIHNLSNNGVYLSYLERIATIEFSYVDVSGADFNSIKNAIEDESHKKYQERSYCFDYGIQDIRYFPTSKNGLPRDCGLLSLDASIRRLIDDEYKEILNNDEFKSEIQNKILEDIKVKIWIPIFVAIISGLFGLLSVFLNSGATVEKIARLEEQIEVLEGQIAAPSNEIATDVNIEHIGGE